MTHNGLALGEEADFEALNCLLALNLKRGTRLYLSTEPAFLPNACYAIVVLFQSLFVRSFCLSWCVGLVALLHFWRWSLLRKKANLLPKAMTYDSIILSLKFKSLLVGAIASFNEFNFVS